jgi:hypothetical protein
MTASRTAHHEPRKKGRLIGGGPREREPASAWSPALPGESLGSLAAGVLDRHFHPQGWHYNSGGGLVNRIFSPPQKNKNFTQSLMPPGGTQEEEN